MQKIRTIGVLSDTHDHLLRLDRAIEFFNEKKVDFLLHGGDYVAPFTIARMKKLACDWRGVFGNNDGEKEGLRNASGDRITEAPGVFIFAGRKIVLVHDLKSIGRKTFGAQVVISGHTHIPSIKKSSFCLMVNPGECGGWLTGKSTVAILELSTLRATIHEL